MTLLVQEYLKTHSIAQLKAEQGIKSSAKPGDRFFSLNYDQIESKAGPMVNQCRGLILSTLAPLQDAQVTGQEPVGDTQVMARGFDRFFNLGDFNASPVDMDDPGTVFFEKIDGTMCLLYWNHVLGSWQVATRSVPLADKSMSDWEGTMTFSNLFDKALSETLLSFSPKDDSSNHSSLDTVKLFLSKLNQEYTYIFELTTPLNRIVVNYPDYRVHLLGIRNAVTGEEYSVKDGLPGVPSCPSHKLNNQEELMAFVGSKPPFEQEGVVAMDKNFNRVKIKSLAYMAYNRVRDSAANSPRAVMELLLTEKLDDVMPILELHVQKKGMEFQEGMREFSLQFEKAYQEIFSAVQSYPEEQRRKMFALSVQERKLWIGPLMDRFSGRSKDFSDYIQKKKLPNGSFPDVFLDNLISAIGG